MMVELVVLQSISYMAGALGVCVAAVYYVMNLRVQQTNMKQTLETRQAQLFMQIFARQYDIEQRKSDLLLQKIEYNDVDDFVDKYGPENNPEAALRFRASAAYYEGIGVLVKRNLIDPAMVDDLMSGRIIDFWETSRKYAFGVRERTGDYEAFEFSEYLYNVIKGIQDKQRSEAGFPIR